MQIGFKTGPKSWAEGKQLILDHGAKYAEIWYRHDWQQSYREIFSYLTDRAVNFGLHYWGVVEGNILPSFCHDEEGQYKQGIDSVKQTIDAARRVGAHYVNIHPGSRRLTKLDNDFVHLTILDRPLTEPGRGLELLIAATKELSAYARARNVLLLVETMPAVDSADWSNDNNGRLSVLDTNHASIDMMIQLANNGIFVANDFGHSAANQPSQDRLVMWQALYKATLALADQTKLLHINTVSSPFNGTDSHDGITEEDWHAGVFPDKSQFIELLTIFKDREDVWAIPEPKNGKMVENFLALERYLKDTMQ